MTLDTVYLVDENDQQRRTYTRILIELFNGSGLIIKDLIPLPTVNEYTDLLNSGRVAALVLDQKLEDGGVAYSGTQLSSHLRSIAPKLPIFILTNYTTEPELFVGAEWSVEDIVPKSIVLDITSEEAKIFKARFLRRLGVYVDVLDARAQRYHDLLVKSLKEPLTTEEQNELGLLEAERILPQHTTELQDVKALEDAIAELRRRIGSDDSSSK
jgi:DNA-binding response OmpR family regulator